MSPPAEPVSPTLPQTQAVPGAWDSDPASTNPAANPPRSLGRAVYERRGEYTKQQRIRVKIGTWNVAACAGVENDLDGWFVQGKGVSENLANINLDGDLTQDQTKTRDGQGHPIESAADQEARRSKKASTLPLNDPGQLPGEDEIGLYVLGLQEVMDISSVAEAIRPYNDASISEKWKTACAESLPAGYEQIAQQQLNGILLLIYASPTIAPTITNVTATNVGTGVMGYMGNKGAAIIRVMLGDSTRLVFINSHLAAGTTPQNLERRNWDSQQIIQRTKFDPIDHGNGVVDEVGDTIGDEDFAFWFGDLNYRLADMPGDDVRRLLMLHTRNEYDVNRKSLKLIDKELGQPRPSTSSSVYSESTLNTETSDDHDSSTLHDADELDPDNDPASLQTTLASLLPHDQLHDQMRRKKAFHDGWREGPIRFLPTYKYDVGSVGVFDSSEKKRAPSWCDRILYRTRKDYSEYKQRVEDEEQAKKRDVEMKARGLDQTDDVLFDYDPEADGAYDELDDQQETVASEQVVATKEGFEDRIQLEYYTSHQRVLSSDHKPLDAIFSLTYNAVDREQRSIIQTEIAREMDKDENESRPQITLVVDHAEVKDGSSEGINFEDVKFDVPTTHNITVANTGQVSAKISFVDELVSSTPSWLNASFTDEGRTAPLPPREHTLEPGDTATIAITIHVTSPTDARYLNDTSHTLETVLVLRVDGGRDHFITLHGNWLNTCFGLSLDQLTRIPESGARTATISSSLLEQDVKWSSPRELFRLTEGLEESLERTVAEAGMKDPSTPTPWSTAGWPFLTSTYETPLPVLASISASVRNSLDTNAPFPAPATASPDTDADSAATLTQQRKVEALAYVLLQFLASLDGGIIDAALWTTISTALAERERTRAPKSAAANPNNAAAGESEAVRSLVLETISPSPARSVAFTFITFMLGRVANEVAPLHGLDQEPGGVKLSSPSKAAGAGKAGAAAAAAVLGRVRGASEDPRVAKRREVEKRFAEVFEKVVFRAEEGRGREARREEDKRRGVLGLFMHGRWGDG